MPLTTETRRGAGPRGSKPRAPPQEIRTAEEGPEKPEEGKEKGTEPTGLPFADGGRRRKKTRKSIRRRRATRRR